MVTDSIQNPSIALALSNPKDFAKKKRGNRSAKLKQCKRDARREQWLSQGKSKGGRNEGLIGGGGGGGGTVCTENDRDMPVKKLEIKPRAEEEIFGNGLSMHHSSDSESSPSNSPTSHNSCFSGGKSGEEEEEDDCLDDWEAMADALAADEERQQKHNTGSEYHLKLTNEPFCENGISVTKHCPAWSADDAFRPQSLPTLSRMYSAQINSERHFAPAGPTSCPICFDDLDLTDSSFLPCLCGFRLCLFCHKRIIENDGRCPGCRKEYDYEHDNKIL